MSLHALSYTVLLDQTCRERVFQGNTQTFRQIVDEVLKHTVHTGMIYTADKQAKPERVIVQYKESDWEFLKRLAMEQGQIFMADCNNIYPCIYFGVPVRKKYYEIDCDDIQLQHKRENSKIPYEECIITSKDYYEIGELINLKDKKWRIEKLIVFKKQGEAMIQYRLKPEKYCRIPSSKYNHNLKGISIPAIVKDVKNARVKIESQCDLDQDWGDGIWYDYATIYTSPNGTGWYCMPEVGEKVRLYFPDGFEEHAYIISNVHKEGDQTRLDPNKKSFRTRYGKELYFTPESIVLTNNAGISICLQDNKGIFIKSDYGISIQSDSVVDIQSGQEVLIQGADCVSVQQNENIIVINDGIYEKGRNIKHL